MEIGLYEGLGNIFVPVPVAKPPKFLGKPRRKKSPLPPPTP